VTFKMHVPLARNFLADIPHANLHSCLRNNIFCTPFVANTPTLATHAPALKGTLDHNGNAYFENENKLAANQYTIIAHGRWYDTAGLKHDMARAHIVDVESPPPDMLAEYILYSLLGVLGAAALVGAALFARHLVKKYRAAIVAAQELERKNKARVHEAVEQVQTALYPFCVCRFSDFMTFGELKSHEYCRDNGYLKMLDTWDMALDFSASNPTLFISHQWLGLRYPDPNSMHYPLIVKAAQMICDKFGVSPSKLYVWVDYLSMPQLCKASLSHAISSLCVYTALCKYFLICTPSTTHADKKCPCNSETYLRRGWCRFEQWARLTTGGINNMFVFRNEEIESLSNKEFEPWVQESINVFDGEFNEESQMNELVSLVLGLWGYALLDLAKTDVKPLKLAVEQKRARVFPKKHFGALVDVLEAEISNKASTFHVSGRSAGFEKSARRLSGVHKDQVALAAAAFTATPNSADALGPMEA